MRFPLFHGDIAAYLCCRQCFKKKRYILNGTIATDEDDITDANTSQIDANPHIPAVNKEEVSEPGTDNNASINNITNINDPNSEELAKDATTTIKK